MRVDRSSLVKMFDRWRATVFSLITSAAAISLVGLAGRRPCRQHLDFALGQPVREGRPGSPKLGRVLAHRARAPEVGRTTAAAASSSSSAASWSASAV